MKNNLAYSNSWLRAIEAFADIEQQKRFWFSVEGPEGASYEDKVQNLMSVSRILQDSQYDDYLSPKCRELLRVFVNMVDEYDTNPDTFLKGCSSEELFADPKWMEIVQFAKKTYCVLEEFNKEIMDENEKSS